MSHPEHQHSSPHVSTIGLPIAPAGETALDPVCGMTVDPVTAAGSYTHAGATYHFCSRHCLEKFKSDPGKYLAAKSAESCCAHAPAAPAVPGTKYTCPMH